MKVASSNRRGIDTLAMLGLLAVVIACSPHHAPAADTHPPKARGDATIFTDTALYRQICVEADSGLTPASGRCTLRDQGVEFAKPVRPQPPARP